jgi:hypothetical protein
VGLTSFFGHCARRVVVVALWLALASSSQGSLSYSESLGLDHDSKSELPNKWMHQTSGPRTDGARLQVIHVLGGRSVSLSVSWSGLVV